MRAGQFPIFQMDPTIRSSLLLNRAFAGGSSIFLCIIQRLCKPPLSDLSEISLPAMTSRHKLLSLLELFPPSFPSYLLLKKASERRLAGPSQTLRLALHTKFRLLLTQISSLLLLTYCRMPISRLKRRLAGPSQMQRLADSRNQHRSDTLFLRVASSHYATS